MKFNKIFYDNTKKVKNSKTGMCFSLGTFRIGERHIGNSYMDFGKLFEKA